MDAASFRSAFRTYAGGVTIIATGKGSGQRRGLTVTSVCSLSDDPPTLIACVNAGAAAHPFIRAERCFSVNLLSAGQEQLAECFAGKTSFVNEERFAFGKWSVLMTGSPVLDGALANFDCELVEEYTRETHSIFVGLVREVRIQAESDPLIYMDGKYLQPHLDARVAEMSSHR